MIEELQTGVDDCLTRLPEVSRLGVQSIALLPGTAVGDAPIAVDVAVALETGGTRLFAVRSHVWIDGYFEGKGRADSCRSLLNPPDILAIVEPTVLVEKITPDSIVRGVMCYLRNEQPRVAPGA